MVGNVTSLLRCVKTAEDTHGRSEAATEAAIEAIGREIVQLHIDDDQKQTGKEATPEDLVAATRAVTEAVAGLDLQSYYFSDQPIQQRRIVVGLVSASDEDQDQVVAAVNLGKKVVSEMLSTCKVRSQILKLIINGLS